MIFYSVIKISASGSNNNPSGAKVTGFLVVSNSVWRNDLNEALFIRACRDAIPGYAKRDFGYEQNCFGHRRRRSNRELSKLTGEKRYPAPDIRPDFQVLGIVEGHAPVFWRLMRKPGTDMIRGT